VAREPAGSEVYAHFPENELPSGDKINSTGPPVPSFSFQVPVSVLPAVVPDILPFAYVPVTDEPVWVMVIDSPAIPVVVFPEPHKVSQVPVHDAIVTAGAAVVATGAGTVVAAADVETGAVPEVPVQPAAITRMQAMPARIKTVNLLIMIRSILS